MSETLPPAPRIWREMLPAAALMIAGLAALALANVGVAGPGGQVLVIGPPGASRAQMLALIVGARGRAVGFGGFANVVVSASPDPDFTEGLRRHGAWLAIPVPPRFGCGSGALWRETVG